MSNEDKMLDTKFSNDGKYIIITNVRCIKY